MPRTTRNSTGGRETHRQAPYPPRTGKKAGAAPTAPTEQAEDNCPICQVTYHTGEEPETPIRLTHCGHEMGLLCAAKWLLIPSRDHGCPVCRHQPFAPRVPQDRPLTNEELFDLVDGSDAGLELPLGTAEQEIGSLVMEISQALADVMGVPAAQRRAGHNNNNNNQGAANQGPPCAVQ